MMNIHDYDLNLNSRFSWAADQLREIKHRRPKSETVFDVGSGNEKLKSVVEALGMRYLSFDINPPNENVREWNIEEPFPYQEKADVIIFLEVIEHLNNPGICIRNLYKVLESGGCLVLSTPNPSWSGSRMHLMGNGTLGMFTKQDLDLNHHVFTPWRHIVEHMLASSGFERMEYFPLGKQTNILAYPFWGIKVLFRFVYRGAKVLLENMDHTAVGALYGIRAYKP